jgi:hypothetical protein
MTHLTRTLVSVALIGIVTMMTGCLDSNDDVENGLWSVEISTGEGAVEVRCEPALTVEQRRTGLMGREYLGDHRGMVFVFDPPANVTFWMKDTKLALDMVFINASSRIVSIVELGPGWGLPDEEVPICNSPGPVRYVMEVNQGFCREHDILVGDLAVVHEPT